MTTIPFSYIARNLYARKLTTALTAAGRALVVFFVSGEIAHPAGGIGARCSAFGYRPQGDAPNEYQNDERF